MTQATYNVLFLCTPTGKVNQYAREQIEKLDKLALQREMEQIGRRTP